LNDKFLTPARSDCFTFDSSDNDVNRLVSISASYNLSKLQILSALLLLEELGAESTSESVSVLSGVSVETVCQLVYRYEKHGLLTRKLLRRKNRLVRGRLYKYEITKHGIETLDELMDRMEKGLTLNLRCQYPVDYSELVILPGLEDDLRQKIYGKEMEVSQ